MNNFCCASPVGSTPRFLGRQKQEQYLRRFEQWDEPTRRAMTDIYKLAKRADGGGEHVLVTLIEAMKHPPIYAFAKENFALRMVLNHARQKGDQARIVKIEESLEDFHVSLDAYMNNMSLEEAEAARKGPELAQLQTTCTRMPPDGGTVKQEYGADLKLIGRFNQSVRELMVKFKNAWK